VPAPHEVRCYALCLRICGHVVGAGFRYDAPSRAQGIASRFGDVLGTTLYDNYGGFAVCVIATTVVYALILPTLLLVPKRLIATADGEAPQLEPAAD
jgi:hypothetical protein